MDPIANFLTHIRNAYRARKVSVDAPYSKIKHELAKILSTAGFLGEVKVEGEIPTKKITATLIYVENMPILSHIKRVSKPSVRMYTPADKIPYTLSGRGLTVLSTSKGLMTDREARKANIGGEIICQVW